MKQVEQPMRKTEKRSVQHPGIREKSVLRRREYSHVKCC